MVYVADVPEDQVIFFDDAKWDYVLNQRYLPTDGADEQAYRQHLRELGVANSFEFFTGRYAGRYPEEERRIQRSWSRVFNAPDQASPTVCGNLWELRREQLVRSVRP